ncbi:hypothetical protein D1003_10990 [Riemerella anatipestifer]|nr:hypothetical protein [Riemerella anatipestifer]
MQTMNKENRTANTGFASGGVTCKLGAFCFYSSSMQVDSFVLRNPPERKARKRYAIFYENTAPKTAFNDFFIEFVFSNT